MTWAQPCITDLGHDRTINYVFVTNFSVVYCKLELWTESLLRNHCALKLNTEVNAMSKYNLSVTDMGWLHHLILFLLVLNCHSLQMPRVRNKHSKLARLTCACHSSTHKSAWIMHRKMLSGRKKERREEERKEWGVREEVSKGRREGAEWAFQNPLFSTCAFKKCVSLLIRSHT